MNPSRLFILRPVATSLFMLAILLVGLLAYRLLPVAALPEVDYPTMQVVTLYPGASPEVIAATITAPLERQLGQMPGLNRMTSTSSAGASVITLQFTLALTLDVAEQQVQAAINAAGNLMPTDLPVPPIYHKVNPADAAVLTLAIQSPTMTLPRVQDLVETRLAQKISQLSGVGLVTISGGQRLAVRIQANTRALAAYGLGLEEVRTSITNAHANMPKGSFDGPSRASTIDANDQLQSADAFGQVIVAYRNGAPVRLADVALVVEDAENTRMAAWANHLPALIVHIQRQPGANVIEVADRVLKLLPQLQASLPGGITVTPLTDRTLTIRTSIRDVQLELLMAVGLVILVIFLFLRHLPATFIPGVAVPLSLVGTFAFMALAGFSINNLTLMALTIATGFVVDDAIVVIENITRHLEAGKSALQASLDGSRQIGFTIVSLTLSLVAVLIPLLFMADVVGRLFREFAITLAVAILLSAVISLTLTPMLCARLLDRTTPPGDISRLVTGYGRWLTRVLDHPRLTLAVALALLGLTVGLAVVIPKGFFPLVDTGILQGITRAPATLSFAAMAERHQHLARLILADPAVANLSVSIGVDGINPTLNSGRLTIGLKPKTERQAPLAAIRQRLQEQAEEAVGLTLHLQPVQELTIEERLSPTQYQLTLESPDAGLLSHWASRLLERLQTMPILRDVTSDQQEQGLQAYLVIDRDAAGRLGLTPAAIDNVLYDAFGQRLIATIFTQANTYRVVLEAQPEFQRGLAAITDLRVTTSSGQQVPLAAVSRLEERLAPLAIHHQGQFPVVTLSFNLAAGTSLNQALTAIEEAQQAIGLPPAIQSGFQGAALAFRKALSHELWLVVAAIVTMYIVLGVLYESLIHPVTILSTLPAAGVGALLGLMVADMELGVVAIIGIILLIGIVKKNAILIIDFALEAQRQQGLSSRQAIHQACLLRFRPILMTTLCALLASLPLMLGTGMGAELRHPLGLTMVAGLLFSQVTTLFTTPVIYLLFEDLTSRDDGA